MAAPPRFDPGGGLVHPSHRRVRMSRLLAPPQSLSAACGMTKVTKETGLVPTFPLCLNLTFLCLMP